MTTAYEFDGTAYTITKTETGFDVRVTEGDVSLILETTDGMDLTGNARWNCDGMRRLGRVDVWTIDRIEYVFWVASRKIRKDCLSAA